MATGLNEMLGLEKGPGNAFCYGRTPWICQRSRQRASWQRLDV